MTLSKSTQLTIIETLLNLNLQRIQKALERSAEIDANNTNINVYGHNVKLRRKVHSLCEKDENRNAAFFAPRIYNVENELEVTY